MNIGISIFATPNANIWNNGLNQNIAFLVMSLRAMEGVGRVFLLNGGDATELPRDLCFEGLEMELRKPEEVTHDVDVVIEMGAALPLEWLKHLKALGCKIISFQVGQPYVGPAETAMFDRKGGAPHNGTPWDEVWLLPQYMHTSAPLLRTVTRAPVVAMPHLWEPYFLERQLLAREDYRHGFGLSADRLHKPWRIAIFEPNISVAKNGVTPMLICEQAYRTKPESIATMMVLNSFHMKEHLTFNRLAANLDLTRHGKATYEARVAFLDCMVGQKMDAVVSHSWENEQNYLSYEVLYGGYPLIHNSRFLRDAGMGFYYPDFSAQEGARCLLQAHEKDADFWRAYKTRSLTYLKTVSPHDPANITMFRSRLMAKGEPS